MRQRVPACSALSGEEESYHYCDTYALILQRTDVEPWELVAAFFQAVPGWGDHLFALRNRLVGLLGLKTGSQHPHNLDPPYHIGQQISLFRIIALHENEVILGEDDRHLDFFVSLLLVPAADGLQLSVTTLVRFNEWIGRIYFTAIQPFHRLIVPIMMRAMAARINQRNLPQHKAKTAFSEKQLDSLDQSV